MSQKKLIQMKNLCLNILFFAFFFLMQNFINPSIGFSQNKTIQNSAVVWKAYKVAGSHTGTLDLKSGYLLFDGSKLTGGEFVIDMTSIACTDLTGEYKGKLEGHLKSDDFFSVEKHRKSTLKITKAKSIGKNAYSVKADLIIKGITKPIKFNASIYGNKAIANIKVDRTKFDVKYGSGSFFDDLQDNMIYDEFDLVIDLEF